FGPRVPLGRDRRNALGAVRARNGRIRAPDGAPPVRRGNRALPIAARLRPPGVRAEPSPRPDDPALDRRRAAQGGRAAGGPPLRDLLGVRLRLEASERRLRAGGSPHARRARSGALLEARRAAAGRARAADALVASLSSRLARARSTGSTAVAAARGTPRGA